MSTVSAERKTSFAHLFTNRYHELRADGKKALHSCTIVNLIAEDHSPDDILEAYPYLEGPDIQAALRYAAE